MCCLEIKTMKSAPTHKTSYDCAHATQEHELAIGAVESPAKLDLEMNLVSRVAQEKPSKYE